MNITKNLIISQQYQLIILLLLALVLNMNTIFNGYTLDDDLVITKNSLVEKGIRGIPEILSTELFHGLKTEGPALSQARYRPFVLVIFAMEYQFFGQNPIVSHLINVILFALLIALLYKLLNNYVFRGQHQYLAFFTCLLYTCHPVHCEVIASVKSRDELITYILLITSLINILRCIEKPTALKWIFAFICFFTALLTRESAVTFIAVVPLILYFFFNRSIKQSLLFTLPLFAITACYLVLRFSIIGPSHSTENINILNSPYLFASVSEAFATKIFVLLKYLLLLLFPHPLSYEYGYNQIPYIELKSFQFIVSFIVLICLIVYALFAFKRKSLFSFCIMYFMLTISLVSNFVVDIGTPLSERFLFQPSLAICIIIAAIFIRAEKSYKVFSNGALLIIIFLFSIKTYNRNSVWKDSETLLLTDVISSPNSVRTNLYAGEMYIAKANTASNWELIKENFKKAVYYEEKCITIFSNTPRAESDLVIAYSGLFNCYKSADLFFMDNNLDPSDPKVKKILNVLCNEYYKEGNGYYENNNFDQAIEYYLKCLKIDSSRVEAWYTLGGIYFLKDDTAAGNRAWEKVKLLEPEHRYNKNEFSQ